MTDKQIIIDGVPVQDCVFFFTDIQEEIICDVYPTCGGCKGINCYYKQLKRKEQECEWLQLWLPIVTRIEKQFGNPERAKGIDYLAYTEQIFAELDQLKVENEELKKVNNHIENNRKQKADKLMRIEKLIIACSTGYTDEFIQELLVILHEPEPSSFENKYKAILAEIRDIMEKMQKMSEGNCSELIKCFFKDKRCEKCNENKCLVYWFDIILQKISECEVGND